MYILNELNVRMTEIAQREMNKRGWTQVRFGKEMKLDESEVSKLLSYKRNWTWQLIEKFKDATGEDIKLFVVSGGDMERGRE